MDGGKKDLRTGECSILKLVRVIKKAQDRGINRDRHNREDIKKK
jgi:hypothetical protein